MISHESDGYFPPRLEKVSLQVWDIFFHLLCFFILRPPISYVFLDFKDGYFLPFLGIDFPKMLTFSRNVIFALINVLFSYFLLFSTGERN